jgi:hypothetical protein
LNQKQSASNIKGDFLRENKMSETAAERFEGNNEILYQNISVSNNHHYLQHFDLHAA